MKISAHTLVKNEENFLWYSVMSVIDHVDMMYLWDMGSDDKTPEIIKSLKAEYKNKINAKFLKSDSKMYTKYRQEMLDADDSDWFIIVDGDEVWWEDSIKQVIDIIHKKGDKLDSIISSYYNAIGDMYHYQDDSMGKYSIDNITGHITIRAINRNIKGLRHDLPHGQHGIFDGDHTLIQQRDKNKRLDLTQKKSYIHLTHLRRSNLESERKVNKRYKKFKVSKGINFDLDFYYPESFFMNRPDLVPNVWRKRSSDYEMKATLLTPLKKIKRLLPSKSGY